MPILKYLADTNVISDWMRGAASVTKWLSERKGEVAVSTFTIAELRWGIELKEDRKARRELERKFEWILEEYEGLRRSGGIRVGAVDG